MVVSFTSIPKQKNETWTDAELQTANTGKNISYFNDVEKETLKYINLARLYPKKFGQLEIKDYTGTSYYVNYVKDSPFKQTLLSTLSTMNPVPALVPDLAMTEIADCFSAEQGKNGTRGHDRKKCPKGYAAECIAYGMDTGRDAAIELLIDHRIASLGHRKTCLEKKHKVVGISFGTHKEDRYLTVLDFH